VNIQFKHHKINEHLIEINSVVLCHVHRDSRLA